MKFELTIESDNDDNGPEMVAEALERVVSLLDDWAAVRPGDRIDGILRDRNGNTVGHWEMSET